jgi:antitoxin component YwqK of YwqJK toxin-antitoxin module
MRITDSIKRLLGVNIINDNGINEEYWDRKLKKRYSMKNGKLHGKYLVYNWDKINHWIELESNYDKGLLHGVTKYYWKKKISAEGNFNYGNEIGVIKKYFRCYDELTDAINHPVLKEMADLNQGIYEEYSNEGKILEKSQIDNVKFTEGSSCSQDGYQGGIHPVRSGLSEKWFENGILKEIGYWAKNNTSSIYNLSHRKGKHQQFHINGNLFKEGEWQNKAPFGTHKFFYPNGNLEFEVEYFTANDNLHDSSFPEKESIKNERWYNQDGSLMSAEEIILKGGIDPRKKSIPSGINVSWSRESLDTLNYAVINDIKFKRLGTINFYHSYYTHNYDLGHSYELI